MVKSRVRKSFAIASQQDGLMKEADHSINVYEFCCASVVVRKTYMYNVQLTMEI